MDLEIISMMLFLRVPWIDDTLSRLQLYTHFSEPAWYSRHGLVLKGAER